MRTYFSTFNFVCLSIASAAVISPKDRNYGTILDRQTFQVESGHDSDDSNNNNDHLNNANKQLPKTSGFSRALLPPPPPPPPPSWKWWRYHTPSDSDILEQLLQQQRYNRRERPPIDGTLQVNISVMILSATPTRDSGHEFVLVLNQEWLDSRLIHESRPGVSGLQLNAIHHLDELWLPELDLVSENQFMDKEMSRKNQEIHVKSNGYVKYLKKTSLKLLCKFFIEDFPIAVQRCTFNVESIEMRWNLLGLDWELALQTKQKSVASGLLLVLLASTGKTVDLIGDQIKPGNFSCLRVEIELERRLERIWTQYYFPDIVLGLSSIFAFCLSQPLSRLLVTISSLLTYLVLMTTGHRKLNVELVENIDWSPLDIWSHATLTLLFLIFIEFTLITLCERKTSNSKLHDVGIPAKSSNVNLTPTNLGASGPHMACASIKGKCDCAHFNNVNGSHPNMSLLMDGDICIRCNTCLRCLDHSETISDNRMAFQNVFERRDRFHQLTNRATPTNSTNHIFQHNIRIIMDKTFGAIFLILYISFLAIYFSKYFG